jgi:hypothetical protein
MTICNVHMLRVALLRAANLHEIEMLLGGR